MDETLCEHRGEEEVAPLHAVVPPLYLNSLHTFDTIGEYLGFKDDQEQYIYGRVSNPTVALLECKLAALERGAGALCFGSGMAAITSAIMACAVPGDHIIAVESCYGPTRRFLTEQMRDRYGVDVDFVRGEDAADFEAVLRENTKLFYLESPSSLVFTLTNLGEVALLAKARGIRTIIDNTWGTPLYQKPLTLGIDISLHSLSKYIGGHSDIIGGALICGDEALCWSIRMTQRELWGGIMGPFEAWLALRGLRSLPARLALHSSNAATVANHLAAHPQIARLLYPGHPSFPQFELAQRQMSGYSGLMSFVPALNFEQTCQMVDSLRLFRRGVSWGGVESLVCMPFGRGTEEAAAASGGARNLVRISVGQENAADLIADLDQALSSH
jgi:cystathionine gamma-lyase